MFLNKLMGLLIGVFWSVVCLANPPVEILQSCKNMKPANATIVMDILQDPDYKEKTEANCREQFVNEMNGKHYGWGDCNDKAYLMIADKKIPLESAVNLSINPAVKPEAPIIPRPMWWRIDKGDKSWICLISPMSDTGQASNFFQYYIVEDAFDIHRDNYALYFYFFNKDVYKIM